MPAGTQSSEPLSSDLEKWRIGVWKRGSSDERFRYGVLLANHADYYQVRFDDSSRVQDIIPAEYDIDWVQTDALRLAEQARKGAPCRGSGLRFHVSQVP